MQSGRNVNELRPWVGPLSATLVAPDRQVLIFSCSLFFSILRHRTLLCFRQMDGLGNILRTSTVVFWDISIIYMERCQLLVM